MKKALNLWSVVVFQAVALILLDSFGIMSVMSFRRGGYVVAAIWFVLFANVFKWFGNEPGYIIKMTAIFTVVWIVIWTLTELFVVSILYNFTEVAAYVFYGLECVVCFGSVFLFAARHAGKKMNKNIFIILAMVLVAFAYVILTGQVIKTVTDFDQGQSLFDIFTGGASMPSHAAMEKVNAIFYAIESSCLISMFLGEEAVEN